MKKYLYLLLGLGGIAWAATITVWFYSDIIYLFSNFSALTSQVRTVAVIVSWFFGITYFWYGIKSNKISGLTNVSAVVLLTSLILSLVLGLFSCYSIGGACPPYTKIFNSLYILVFIVGISISFILLLTSLIKTKNYVRTQ